MPLNTGNSTLPSNLDTPLPSIAPDHSESLSLLLLTPDHQFAASVKAALGHTHPIAPNIVHAPTLPLALSLLTDSFNAALVHIAPLAPNPITLEDLNALARAATDLPIIALDTAYNSVSARHALENGAQDFLSLSDLNPTVLERTISHAIHRKKAETDLRISEVRFRALFEQSPNPICIHAPSGLSVGINSSVLERFNMTREQASRYNVLQDEHLLEQEGMAAIHRAFAGESAPIPLIKFSSDEHGWANEELTRWLKGIAYPIKDQSGDVNEVVLIWEDVTAQEEVEGKLRQTETQYQAVFEASTDGLAIAELSSGKLVEVNPAFAAMHGYTRQEMVGMHPRAFVHPDDYYVQAEFMESAGRGERAYAEGQDVRKDGTIFNIEVQAAPFIYNGKPHILAVMRDSTERIKARELLEQRVDERTRELATLLDLSSDMTSTLEIKPLLLRILEQLKLVAGYTRASLSFMSEGDNEGITVSAWGSPSDRPLPNHIPIEMSELADVGDRLERCEAVIIADIHSDHPDALLMSRAIEKSLLAQPTEVARPLREAFAAEHSMLLAPIALKDRVIGGLLLRHNQPNFYTERHAEFAKAIANQAAIAAENARLLTQAHDKARLEERQRLARELHDSVTQALFSTNLIARSLEMLLQRDGTYSADVMDKTIDLRQLTQGALAEMRALIFELRPGALEEEGLMEALRKHAAGIEGREELKVDIIHTGEGTLPRLKPAAEEALYRIAQEALHNVVKHARATRAGVTIGARDGSVLMQISDNGIGFNTEEFRAGHMGLGTMGQRARALHAEYVVSSRVGEGSSITVQVPISEWQLAR